LLVGGVSLVIHLFVTLAIAVFLVGIVPPYVHFFKVNDTLLPSPTIQLVTWSETAIAYWYLFVIAFLAVDAPLAFGLQFLPRNMRWLKVCWFDAYLLAAIAFLLYASIALCMPIAAMMNAGAGA
jgi:hypothetical protein